MLGAGMIVLVCVAAAPRTANATDAAASSPLLWPKPTHVTSTAPTPAQQSTSPGDVGISDGSIGVVRFDNFSFVLPSSADPTGVLAKAATRYTALIQAVRAPDKLATQRFSSNYAVVIRVEDMSVPLALDADMNESYVLEASETGCTLSAGTVWGALRGTYSSEGFSSRSVTY